MGKWMDLATQLEAASDMRDNRDNRDIRDSSPLIVPIVPNVPQKLLPGIRAGLVALKTMAAPRLVLPEVWPTVVADALTLAKDGWASKAMALGWDVLDLYGAVTGRDGYADADGLAVWLAGRPLLAISATYASVGDDNSRSYFNRCNRLGTALLWDLGK